MSPGGTLTISEAEQAVALCESGELTDCTASTMAKAIGTLVSRIDKAVSRPALPAGQQSCTADAQAIALWLTVR